MFCPTGKGSLSKFLYPILRVGDLMRFDWSSTQIYNVGQSHWGCHPGKHVPSQIGSQSKQANLCLQIIIVLLAYIYASHSLTKLQKNKIRILKRHSTISFLRKFEPDILHTLFHSRYCCKNTNIKKNIIYRVCMFCTILQVTEITCTFMLKMLWYIKRSCKLLISV